MMWGPAYGLTSVADPLHFDTNTDPDPRSTPLAMDPDPAIVVIYIQYAT